MNGQPRGKGRYCMPVTKAVIDVIREWITKAENDLITAVHTLKLNEDCPTDTVCFHAQQCVEKYLKALLVFRATPFPKSHDIALLTGLLPMRLRPKLDISHILKTKRPMFEKIDKYNREQEKSGKIAISPDHLLVVDLWYSVAKEENKFPKEFMQFVSLWEAFNGLINCRAPVGKKEGGGDKNKVKDRIFAPGSRLIHRKYARLAPSILGRG